MQQLLLFEGYWDCFCFLVLFSQSIYQAMHVREGCGLRKLMGAQKVPYHEILDAIQTHCHIRGFAWEMILKRRQKVTRKRPIVTMTIFPLLQQRNGRRSTHGGKS